MYSKKGMISPSSCVLQGLDFCRQPFVRLEQCHHEQHEKTHQNAVPGGGGGRGFSHFPQTFDGILGAPAVARLLIFIKGQGS